MKNLLGKNSLKKFNDFKLNTKQGSKVKGGNSEGTDETEIVVIDTITT